MALFVCPKRLERGYRRATPPILDGLLHFSTMINIHSESHRLREQRKAGGFGELAERQQEG